MAKILIIEDEAALRESLAELLGYQNHETLEAGGGREGIAMIKNYLPDLVLCDITMPDLDGYVVLRMVREDQMTNTIPFVFLTARTQSVDRNRGLAMGANAYLEKPFTIEGLFETINSFV